MPNYRLLTGPFAGEIVEDVQILDIPFDDLDDDLKARIIWEGFSADKFGRDDYEMSWQTEPSDEPVTMKPLSEQ